MARGMALGAALLALAACDTKPLVAPETPVPVSRGVPQGYQIAQSPSGLIVQRVATPFRADEGIEAKRTVNGWCGPNGVNSGLDDRFEDGSWIFPGGCK
ncbi:hypothetical protein [Thioclava sp. GXIMD2076]|uniref:Uncharacterized protein n=1 Tax=Thioclava kandeliae TaxID=3070818 RepID=A0ABV1SC53_9RHOB